MHHQGSNKDLRAFAGLWHGLQEPHNEKECLSVSLCCLCRFHVWTSKYMFHVSVLRTPKRCLLFLMCSKLKPSNVYVWKTSTSTILKRMCLQIGLTGSFIWQLLFSESICAVTHSSQKKKKNGSECLIKKRHMQPHVMFWNVIYAAIGAGKLSRHCAEIIWLMGVFVNIVFNKSLTLLFFVFTLSYLISDVTAHLRTLGSMEYLTRWRAHLTRKFLILSHLRALLPLKRDVNTWALLRHLWGNDAPHYR